MNDGEAAQRPKARSKLGWLRKHLPPILDNAFGAILAVAMLAAAAVIGTWLGISAGQSASACPSQPSALNSGEYQTPALEPNAPQTSFTFCPVNVNDGKPISNKDVSLSGVVKGHLLPDQRLALVSHPDVTQCDMYGNPGANLYYFVTEIDPATNNGTWHVQADWGYDESVTISRRYYFLLTDNRGMGALKGAGPEGLEALTDNDIRLAQFDVPGNNNLPHTCKPGATGPTQAPYSR